MQTYVYRYVHNKNLIKNTCRLYYNKGGSNERNIQNTHTSLKLKHIQTILGHCGTFYPIYTVTYGRHKGTHMYVHYILSIIFHFIKQICMRCHQSDFTPVFPHKFQTSCYTKAPKSSSRTILLHMNDTKKKKTAAPKK